VDSLRSWKYQLLDWGGEARRGCRGRHSWDLGVVFSFLKDGWAMGLGGSWFYFYFLRVREEKQIFFWFSHLPSFPSSFMFFLSTFLCMFYVPLCSQIIPNSTIFWQKISQMIFKKWRRWSNFPIQILQKQQFRKCRSPRETFCNLAQLQYPKTFRKVTADNFPQWVFSGAKVAELRHTQSGPDPARHPVLDVGYPRSPFHARMS